MQANLVTRPVSRRLRATALTLTKFGFFCGMLLLMAHVAHAEDNSIFSEAQTVGQDMLKNLLWLSGLAAVLGFVMAGHAFTSGDVERGKTMLKSTLIGSVCIYGAVGLVHFISSKFSQTSF